MVPPILTLAQLGPGLEVATRIGNYGATTLLAIGCAGLLYELTRQQKVLEKRDEEHRKEITGLNVHHAQGLAALGASITTLQVERLKDMERLYQSQIADKEELKDAALGMSTIAPAIGAEHAATRANARAEADRVIHAISELGRSLHEETRTLVRSANEKTVDVLRAASPGKNAR